MKISDISHFIGDCSVLFNFSESQDTKAKGQAIRKGQAVRKDQAVRKGQFGLKSKWTKISFFMKCLPVLQGVESADQ